MRHDCKNGKWWDLISLFDETFCIAVGNNDGCFSISFFKSKAAAYKQKNRWLTRFDIRD